MRSAIFKKSQSLNPLSFGIIVPPKNPDPRVPAGIASPRTFIEVGSYLHSLLAAEVKLGANKHIAKFKGKGSLLTKTYQAQFVAYTQGIFPFSTPLGLSQTPLQWWKVFENSDNAGVLAVCFSFSQISVDQADCQLGDCNQIVCGSSTLNGG